MTARETPTVESQRLGLAEDPLHVIAERSILGAVLLHQDALNDLDSLIPADFDFIKHRLIFEAMRAARAEAGQIDLIVVEDQLRRRGLLPEAGGREYLLDLMESVVSVAGLSNHVALVKEHAQLRALRSFARELEATVHAGAPLGHVLEDAGQHLADLNKDRAGRCGETLADVLTRWRSEGPVTHVPTGIAGLDEATGGGFTLGSRVYIAGAPDAGKTGLLLQLLESYHQAGLTCGLLAVDEDPDDIALRILQRRGFSRALAEARTELPEPQVTTGIMLFDSSWTIEKAGNALARLARKAGTAAVLGVDSIQTARCDAEDGSPSRYETVTARVGAVRALATAHRMLVIATSEMGRGAYRSQQGRDTTTDMAAAKESGAIEYSARVLIALRSVPGESDLVSCRLPKNKLGPSTPADDPHGIVLRIDRARQTFTEVPGYIRQEEQSRVTEAMAKLRADAAVLARVMAAQPGLTGRGLRGAARALAGEMSDARSDAGLALLDAAVVRVPAMGKKGGGGKAYHLEGSKVAPEVLELVPVEERPTVLAARPPTEVSQGVPTHLGTP